MNRKKKIEKWRRGFSRGPARALVLAGRELLLAPPELRRHGRHGVAEEVVQRLVHRAAHLQVSAQLCLHFTALTQPGSQG